ncbi:MAG TPA: hypothetical protein VEB22_03115 [Phycisphaerales bacterium]|nr:hypothetical protein [Phycisphaerales bacterium]
MSVASWGGVIVVALGATVYVLTTGRYPPLWVLGAALAIPVAIGLADVLSTFARVRTLRRNLREHRGLICRSCHHPLPREAPVGRCPECGAAYTHAEVIAAWR